MARFRTQPFLAIVALLGWSGRTVAQGAPAAAPEAPAEPNAGPQTTESEPVANGEANEAAPTEDEPTPVEITVVGAHARRAPGSAHVVSNRVLERYEYDDPHAALQLVPGVYVRQEDGVGLRPNIGIRGGSPDRSKKVALFEDGVPFAPAPYSASAAYYFPVFTRIYQMRVIKGPSAITYGPQTVGGAIELMTRPIPATPSGAIDLATGDYGYGKIHGHFGSSDERIGFLVEGVHLRSDGFKELPTGADTGFYRNEYMFKGSYNFAPTSPRLHEIGLKLTYSEEVSNETYLGLSDADFRKNPLARYGASALDRMQWHRTALALTHVIEPSERMKITSVAYRNDFWRRWRKVNGFRDREHPIFDVLTNPDTAANSEFHNVLTGAADATSEGQAILIGPNERTFVSQGVSTKVEMKAITGPLLHRLEYGLRLHNDRVERRHSQDAFMSIGGQLIPDGTVTEVTTFNEAYTDALSLHAFDSVSWGDLTLTPGIRLELLRSVFRDRDLRTHQGSAHRVVLPGIGAYYGLNDSFGVLGGVYRGMSPPAPDGEAIVEPEISVNYEAGARFSKGPARAELIGYYNDYQNLADVCTFSTSCPEAQLDRQVDAGRARIYGLEAFAEHELPVADGLKFPLRISYTLTQTEFQDDFVSPQFSTVAAGDEMPYVPRHQGFASAGVELEKLGGYVAANYVSKMREVPGQGDIDKTLATDDQFTVDVGAHYRPFEWLRIYGTVRNLFDEHYIVSRRPFGARPNAPRWMQVGVKANF